MNKIFYMGFLAIITCKTYSQNSIKVEFMLGNELFNLQKDFFSLSPSDTLKIRLKSNQNINVSSVSIYYFTLIPSKKSKGQEQLQQMQKMKLNDGNKKTFPFDIKNQKNPLLKIPVKDFYEIEISKLKIKIIGCKDVYNNTLIKDNQSFVGYSKSYEFYEKHDLIKH